VIDYILRYTETRFTFNQQYAILLTILMGHRESLVGVGLIVSDGYCCIAEGSVWVL